MPPTAAASTARVTPTPTRMVSSPSRTSIRSTRWSICCRPRVATRPTRPRSRPSSRWRSGDWTSRARAKGKNVRSEITTTLISPTGPLERPPAPARATDGGEVSFSGELGKALEAVDKLQIGADEQARMVAEGGGNLHEMAIAMEKADVSMRLALKVRNKVVDAYNEIMRMSL